MMRNWRLADRNQKFRQFAFAWTFSTLLLSGPAIAQIAPVADLTLDTDSAAGSTVLMWNTPLLSTPPPGSDYHYEIRLLDGYITETNLPFADLPELGILDAQLNRELGDVELDLSVMADVTEAPVIHWDKSQMRAFLSLAVLGKGEPFYLAEVSIPIVGQTIQFEVYNSEGIRVDSGSAMTTSPFGAAEWVSMDLTDDPNCERFRHVATWGGGTIDIERGWIITAPSRTDEVYQDACEGNSAFPNPDNWDERGGNYTTGAGDLSFGFTVPAGAVTSNVQVDVALEASPPSIANVAPEVPGHMVAFTVQTNPVESLGQPVYVRTTYPVSRLDSYDGVAESSLRPYWYDPIGMQWQEAALGTVTIDRVNHTVGFSTDRLGLFALAAELDTDRDGLGNHEEDRHQTFGSNWDSDGDGISDGDEIWLTRSDPNDALKMDADDQYAILPALPDDLRTWVTTQIATDSDVSPIVQTLHDPVGQPGPSIWTHGVLSLQDGFPAAGYLDMAAGLHSVRLDMAQTVQPQFGWQPAGGDSIVCEIAPVEPGTDLLDVPVLHYELDPNPIYAPERWSGWPNTGTVLGDPVFTPMGQAVPFRFSFDLPDEGFFFPGDVLHYYVEAIDNDFNVITLPSDISDFDDFSPESSYAESFTVRALPTISDSGTHEHPSILVWIDSDDLLRANAWSHTLDNLGLEFGVHYDVYYTNGARYGVGNGLGGRATDVLLAGYDTILYSSGVLDNYTLGSGDQTFGDPGDDVGLLTMWLNQDADRNLVFTGDNLVGDLYDGDLSMFLLVETVMGVQFVDGDALQSGPSSPRVQPNGAVPYFTTAFALLGGAPEFNTYDAITPAPGAVGFLEFLDLQGLPSPYSAGVLHEFFDGNFNRKTVITFPFNLADVSTQRNKTSITERARLLQEVLYYFGLALPGVPTSVPEPRNVEDPFIVEISPNPSNPRTEISYSLPQRGRLTIDVFDLRGRRVAVVTDEMVEAGPGRAVWKGLDRSGRPVASGVYLYRARALGKEKRGKLTVLE